MTEGDGSRSSSSSESESSNSSDESESFSSESECSSSSSSEESSSASSSTSGSTINTFSTGDASSKSSGSANIPQPARPVKKSWSDEKPLPPVLKASSIDDDEVPSKTVAKGSFEVVNDPSAPLRSKATVAKKYTSSLSNTRDRVQSEDSADLDNAELLPSQNDSLLDKPKSSGTRLGRFFGRKASRSSSQSSDDAAFHSAVESEGDITESDDEEVDLSKENPTRFFRRRGRRKEGMASVDEEERSQELSGDVDDVPEQANDEESGVSSSSHTPEKSGAGIFGGFRRRKSKDDSTEEGYVAASSSNSDKEGEASTSDVDAKSDLETADVKRQPVSSSPGRGFLGGLLGRSRSSDDNADSVAETDIESPLHNIRETSSRHEADDEENSPLAAKSAEHATNKKSRNDDPDVVTVPKFLMWLIIFVIIALLVGMGLTYIATKLAIENALDATPPPPPTLAPTVDSNATTPPIPSPLDCPAGNVALEFVITFDSKPGDVGLLVNEEGVIGTGIWLFDVGSFVSFTQFNRRNFFQVCLPASRSYTIEILDDDGDGLVAPFGGDGNFVYGEWELLFNGESIAVYGGDCDKATGEYCGAYCACRFEVSLDVPTIGACKTECVR